MACDYVFKRVEKKYMIPQDKTDEIIERMHEHMEDDIYGEYTICNIYYDTDNYDLISRSLQKPKYKEKLRLRSYGVPCGSDKAFIEIKKKMSGVVYKRRIDISYDEAVKYLQYGTKPKCDSQILREIDYFIEHYKPSAKLYLAYDRIALQGKEDASLRVTFDKNIRSRTYDLDLSMGDYGTSLFDDESYLMEIKTSFAMPMWLVKILSDYNIYPISFSKYGTIYTKNLQFKEKTICLPV